jgi:hypothetical protein
VGAFAGDVNDRLRDGLTERRSRFDWSREYRIAGTPVDVAGIAPDHLVAVELEWRRADPADNTATLFRHLEEGTLDHERVSVFQVFTGYYDLASGGVSSKRRNAEFVGQVAADALSGFEYHSIEFEMTPPKRGGDRPNGWREVADATVERIADSL